ncbi:hypothetical protein [Streptomyces sp. NPDC001970]
MATMVTSLVWATAACGGGSGESAEPRATSSAEGQKLCGGAVDDAAHQALTLLTGTAELHPTDDDENARTAADALIAGWSPLSSPPHSRDAHPLCSISTEENYGNGPGDVRIRFQLSDAAQAKDDGDIAKSLERYEMGVRASMGTERAYVWFSCKSAELPGSDQDPAYVLGEVENRRAPKGDEGKLRDANATLLHSTSRAVARELGCEADAGLKAKPVLRHSG